VYKYNDNELLYLIKENDDDAKVILIGKYKPLILKYVMKITKDVDEYDDYMQEGLLCLMKAVNTYNDVYPQSFNNYFHLLLKRKFIDLTKKRNSNETITYLEDLEEYVVDCHSISSEEYNCFLEENNIKLSKFELLIYQYRYIENLKPAKIADITKKNIKQVYDAINRIKIKTNKNNKKI
jgi:RNA polymerase sporulation-specific sigma factor